MSVWKAFGRGFDSRRLHQILILLLFCGLLSAEENRITVFEGSQKSFIDLHPLNGSLYLRVIDLQQVLGFDVHPIVGNQNLSVILGNHNVILSADRALVSLDGTLVSLAKPVLFARNHWFVPLDFIPRVLKPIAGKRFLWLESNRSLIVGDVQPNQIQVKYSAEPGFSRVIFQSNRPVGYSIFQEPDGVLIVPRSEDYLPAFQKMNVEDGAIRSISIETGPNQKRAFRITTGELFRSFQSSELSDPPRLVIDFYKREAELEPPVAEPPQEETPAPPTMLPSPAEDKKVLVIDPGHGGSETGAKGQEGTFEKDITMSIARKLKGIIESTTGIRVILTRDGDEIVSLDDRTARANNNKADLFISIHANSTIRGVARGAETYFLSAQATDDEARNSAAVENNAIGLTQEGAKIGDELKLILWDMAQTEYLAESSRLAEMIQQELNEALGISNRGIKQAPFRVLTGATMPAVLIEVGFINNPEEEKLMKNAEYQTKIASAIYRSILRFQNDGDRAGQLSPGSR